MSHGLEINLMNNPPSGMRNGKRRWWELIVGVGEGLLVELAEQVEGGEWGEVEDVEVFELLKGRVVDVGWL